MQLHQAMENSGKRCLYVKGEEVVSVSEELGDYWPKDPIISNMRFAHQLRRF